MKIALAQIDTVVGDYTGNAARVERWTARAAEAGAALVVFPELTLNGYPPRDLLELEEFVAAGAETLQELAGRLAGGPAAVVGFVEAHDEDTGVGRYNAVAWLEGGAVRAIGRKTLLPNYDVFDERRYFDPSPQRTVIEYGGLRFGLTVCEDLWNDPAFWSRRRYLENPLEDVVRQGCDVVLNLSASPYAIGKPRLRARMLQVAARQHGRPILLANLVGGNDSLVFDGSSLYVDAQGELRWIAPAFVETLEVVDVASEGRGVAILAPPPEEAEVLEALVLGLRDYTHKTGFERAVVGLSGGIDSALTAVLAARALGPGQVLGLAMPSRYTSSMSDEDARRLAQRLGIGFEVLPIEPAVEELRRTISALLPVAAGGLTDQNLQARVRGLLLMAISNERGHLVLSTGNKSELSVGYCTLYGDMAGGLAVIGDLSKSWVYRLSRFVNRAGQVIPQRILERPPSAELKEDQTDEESLPPYERLDPILEDIITERLSGERLAARGHDPALLAEVRRMLIQAEYKRRQAAPTLKVTPRAFGEGWRFPIAQRWRG